MTKQDLKELLELVNNIENVSGFCEYLSEKTGRPVATLRSMINNFKKSGKMKNEANYMLLRDELGKK